MIRNRILALLIITSLGSKTVLASEGEGGAYSQFNTGSIGSTGIQLSDTSTLEDYLRYAAMHNAGLEAAFNHWKAELEVVEQSGVLPDPRFNFGYFIQNVETRVGPQNRRIGISQAFPWLGKLKLQKEASMAKANIAEQQYEAKKLRLFEEVKQAYFDYFYLGRAIEITSENVELLTEFERIARSKYEAGSALYADLLRAQVELDKLTDRLQTLRERIPPTKALLNAALNRVFDASIPVPETLPVLPDELNFDRLRIEMRRNNPELKAIDFLAEREGLGVELAKKDFYPDVMVGLDVIDTGTARSPNVSDSGKDAIMLGFSVNLPIWRDKLKAGVAESQRRRFAANRTRADHENMLTAKLELEFFKYQDAIRKVELYRDSLIDKSKQNLSVTKSAFEAGNVDFLSLIDTERILLDFQLNYEQAVTDRAKAIAEMESIVGKPLF